MSTRQTVQSDGVCVCLLEQLISLLQFTWNSSKNNTQTAKENIHEQIFGFKDNKT